MLVYCEQCRIHFPRRFIPPLGFWAESHQQKHIANILAIHLFCNVTRCVVGTMFTSNSYEPRSSDLMSSCHVRIHQWLWFCLSNREIRRNVLWFHTVEIVPVEICSFCYSNFSTFEWSFGINNNVVLTNFWHNGTEFQYEYQLRINNFIHSEATMSNTMVTV